MNKPDINRVVFYSLNDFSNGANLEKAESILNSEVSEEIEEINDVLELHHISQFIDNGVYLKNWSETDIDAYKERIEAFKNIVKKFITNINDSNFLSYFESISKEYNESFWKLIDNYHLYKGISSSQITEVLREHPHQIKLLLSQKNLAREYSHILCEHLKSNPKSAEFILTYYEVKNNFYDTQLHFPKCLTAEDKERIICSYIDSDYCNPNYLPLIQNSKKHKDFRVSDKTKLAAKRKYQQYIAGLSDSEASISFEQGVKVSFSKETSKIKSFRINDGVFCFEYSLDNIKEKKDPYTLYNNFKTLFEYVDEHNIVALTSKENQLGVVEKISGIRSKTEYISGLAFNQSEMSSNAQINVYSKVLIRIGSSLENILKTVFEDSLPKLYSFPSNASLSVPTANASALEKIRIIAPELETVLKQFKLFVENDEIDFELLRMSSSPTPIKNIPSLNDNKYVYINNDDKEVSHLIYLLFSDQTLLAYVDPFKNEDYQNFVDLLCSEEEIKFGNYSDCQRERLNYLIDKNYISVDVNNHVIVNSWNRILVLRDIYENEVGSFHHYPVEIQEEVVRMKRENVVYFRNSLFSESEQNYFNYYLNKSEFTNGKDLRNSYLHGTQASATETCLHEKSYLLYLKLLTLAILKIEDDLFIWSSLKTSSE